MLRKIDYGIVYLRLKIEQKCADRKKTAFGWANPGSERSRQITKAVAVAATQAGLGDIQVRDFRLPLEDSVVKGIIVTDSKNNELGHFWRMKEDVDQQFDSGSYQVGEKKLKEAVAKSIEKEKSGELLRRQHQLYSTRSYPDIVD